MKRCKTCRHWVEPGRDEDYHVWEVCNPCDPDTFERIKPAYTLRMCASPKVVKFETPPESTWVALVDGSGYYTGMATGEDFGCVNHEKGD